VRFTGASDDVHDVSAAAASTASKPASAARRRQIVTAQA
jgi:hypothetical protein